MSKRQIDRIYQQLVYGGLCSMDPLRWEPPITRVAARIHDLKQAGYVIESLPNCPEHSGAHHSYYRLASGKLF